MENYNIIATNDGGVAEVAAGRGGQRPNSGKKPGYRAPTAKRHQVNVRLDDGALAKAKRLGDGNAARGIRRALGCED